MLMNLGMTIYYTFTICKVPNSTEKSYGRYPVI